MSKVTQNERVFPWLDKQLSINNPATYNTYTKKLTEWLKSDKAYYKDGRPKIVQLLQTAQSTLKTATNFDHSANQPFHVSQYAAHPMTQDFIELMQTVDSHAYKFRQEKDLFNKVQTLLDSVRPKTTDNSGSSGSQTVGLKQSTPRNQSSESTAGGDTAAIPKGSQSPTILQPSLTRKQTSPPTETGSSATLPQTQPTPLPDNTPGPVPTNLSTVGRLGGDCTTNSSPTMPGASRAATSSTPNLPSTQDPASSSLISGQVSQSTIPTQPPPPTAPGEATHSSMVSTQPNPRTSPNKPPLQSSSEQVVTHAKASSAIGAVPKSSPGTHIVPTATSQVPLSASSSSLASSGSTKVKRKKKALKLDDLAALDLEWYQTKGKIISASSSTPQARSGLTAGKSKETAIDVDEELEPPLKKAKQSTRSTGSAAAITMPPNPNETLSNVAAATIDSLPAAGCRRSRTPQRPPTISTAITSASETLASSTPTLFSTTDKEAINTFPSEPTQRNTPQPPSLSIPPVLTPVVPTTSDTDMKEVTHRQPPAPISPIVSSSLRSDVTINEDIPMPTVIDPQPASEALSAATESDGQATQSSGGIDGAQYSTPMDVAAVSHGVQRDGGAGASAPESSVEQSITGDHTTENLHKEHALMPSGVPVEVEEVTHNTANMPSLPPPPEDEAMDVDSPTKQMNALASALSSKRGRDEIMAVEEPQAGVDHGVQSRGGSTESVTGSNLTDINLPSAYCNIFCDASVVAVKRGLSKVDSALDIEFTVSKKQWIRINQWNTREEGDRSNGIRYALGCCSAAEFTTGIKSDRTLHLDKVVSACHPAWPQPGGFSMLVPATGPEPQNVISLTQPVVLNTSDIIDITGLIVEGNNTLRFVHHSGLSDFIFFVVFHRPSVANTDPLDIRHHDKWRQWRESILKNFDCTLPLLVPA